MNSEENERLALLSRLIDDAWQRGYNSGHVDGVQQEYLRVLRVVQGRR
jgi:hypothetical protein